VAIAIAAGTLNRDVLGRAAASLGYRVQYWQATLQMIADHPLAGCGPGQFQDAYMHYKQPTASEEIADPHNFLLEIWATAGTPAMLAFLAILGSAAATLARRRKLLPLDGSDSLPRIAGTQRPEEVAEGGSSPAYVVAGALCGLILSVLLGEIGTAPLGLIVVAFALAVMSVTVALLWKWVQHGRLPPLLPAVAAGALLVHWLAAGGIGVPSVAETFWLLLALALNAAELDRPRFLSRSYAVTALASTLLLMLACYNFAYSPVLRCQAALRAAAGSANPVQAKQCLRAAAADDPLAARPWRILAELALAAWRQEPDDEHREQFQTYNAMLRQREPDAPAAWLISGDAYLEIALKSRRRDTLDRAIDCYQKARDLYPNSGLYRARLALALLAAGRKGDFRREADAALTLDRLTPHTDQKLPDDIRSRLEKK
jgi:hypothetical protein